MPSSSIWAARERREVAAEGGGRRVGGGGAVDGGEREERKEGAGWGWVGGRRRSKQRKPRSENQLREDATPREESPAKSDWESRGRCEEDRWSCGELKKNTRPVRWEKMRKGGRALFASSFLPLAILTPTTTPPTSNRFTWVNSTTIYLSSLTLPHGYNSRSKS